MFCCTLFYVHSSVAIILKGKRELVALHRLSSWCLVIVVWLFLAVPWVCLRFVIVVFLIILTYYFSFYLGLHPWSSAHKSPSINSYPTVSTLDLHGSKPKLKSVFSRSS